MKSSLINLRSACYQFLLGLILLQPAFLSSQTFQTTIGHPLPAYEDGVSGLITNTGELLILGNNFNHPSGFFNQNGDMQMIWLNNSGNVLNPGRMIGQDVQETGTWIEKAIDCNGNSGYIIAGNQINSGLSNMLLTFTNLSGVPVWIRSVGLAGTDEQSACVKQDNANNFILVGTKTNQSTGFSTIYAVKTDCSGKLIWEKEYIVGLIANATSVTAFATQPFSCPGMPDEYFITGSTIPLPAGNQSVFLLSINAITGNTVFLKYYDLAPATDDIANCIQGLCPSAFVPNGQLFLSGYSVDPFNFNNPKKVMVMSTDLSGALLWANSYDIQPSYREFSTHCQIDLNKKLILTGKAEETGVSDPPETGQCFLMRMSNNGTVVDWTRIFEMGFSSHGNRVEPTKKNEYFISGHSFTIPVVRQSNYDILAIKTDTLGRTNSNCHKSASTIIINHQPVISSALPTVTSIQSVTPTSLLNKSYQDKQYFCPFDFCDSLDLNAAFNFSVNGNMAFFIDQSTIAAGHNINSWHWDFGDSNTSTSINPTHTYSTSGTYVVCLVVSANFNGMICRDSICRDIVILNGDRCDNVKLMANFNYTGNGNTISFTDLSNLNLNYNIQSWNWNFGDGNSSSSQHPSHTYNTIGSDTVCLMVSGGNAVVTCYDTICKIIKVPYEPNDTCKGNIVKNGHFDQGAIIGDLGAPGASNNWSRWTWSPQVIDFDFCRDSISIQMWGNQAVGEGMMQAVNFQKGGIYQISFCGKRLNTPYPNAQARFRAHVSPVTYLDYDICPAGNCNEIFLSPVLSGNWVSYVSSPWTATQNYDLLTISVWNNFNTTDKAYTSWLRIDDVCIEKVGTVRNNEISNAPAVRLYPNPTNEDAILEFENVFNESSIIKVYDLAGHLKLQVTSPAGEKRFHISLKPFNSGLYFVSVQNTNQRIWNGKLVKE